MIQQHQEGETARGPNGETAVFQGGQWVVQAPAQPQGWQVQPMQTPADRRADRGEQRQLQNDSVNQDLSRQRLDLDRQRLEADQAQQGAGRYDRIYAEARAKADAARYEGAMTGARDAYGLDSRGRQALSLLDRGAPTGPMSGMRIGAGKAVGGVLGFLPGVPDPQQTQQLEQMRILGSQGALGDVGQLKGPLSDRDISFIQSMQINPDATPETNRVVAEAMRWTARRQGAYGAALDRWTRELGSPSAANANGVTFDQWWGPYSEQTLPRPGTPEDEALKAWKAQNPGREAAVVSPSPAGVPGGTATDPASGQAVAKRGTFNPTTGQIEWQ